VLDTHDVHEEDWFELFCPTFLRVLELKHAIALTKPLHEEDW
jgi:hypothetical protein